VAFEALELREQRLLPGRVKVGRRLVQQVDGWRLDIGPRQTDFLTDDSAETIAHQVGQICFQTVRQVADKTLQIG